MNESDSPSVQTVTASANGISLTFDLHQMLTAIDPQGDWRGYNPETEEDHYGPSSLTDQIALLAANELVKEIRTEVITATKNSVAEIIDAEVTSIVREHILGAEVQKTDEFGNPKGAPQPLTSMIIKSAEAMNQSDGYRRESTRMQKLVDEAVGSAFKRELAEAVKTAKEQALAAVQESAASVIRETIQRSARI